MIEPAARAPIHRHPVGSGWLKGALVQLGALGILVCGGLRPVALAQASHPTARPRPTVVRHGASQLAFTFLDRGTCAVPPPPHTTSSAAIQRPEHPTHNAEERILPRPQLVRIDSKAAWSAFWRSTHSRRTARLDGENGPGKVSKGGFSHPIKQRGLGRDREVAPEGGFSHPIKQRGLGRDREVAPEVDFRRYMVIVVYGAPGSAQVRLVYLLRQPRRVLAVVSYVLWRELGCSADRMPYEALLCYRQQAALVVREDAVSRAFNRLVLRAPSLTYVAWGKRRELTLAELVRLRNDFHTIGERFLADLWRLQTAAPYGPYIPYSKLLEARLLEEVVGRVEAARARYDEIARRYRGSVFAREALHHLSLISRRDMDGRTLAVLDAQRSQLASGSVQAGDGKRWMDLASQYEYLFSFRPETLFAAAECYLRGSRDTSDLDVVQNCYLRAADIYATYLNRPLALKAWWECVRRFPEAESVAQVLQKMDNVQRGLDPAHGAGRVYRRYLKAFPQAARAQDVRRRLAGEQ